MTKTNLITGFLGSGKTTSILHLLANKDPAENGPCWSTIWRSGHLTAPLLADSGALLKEIPGGCMCCVNGLPMQVGLNTLLRQGKPDRLLIEPTGLGHPKQILDLLTAPVYEPWIDLRATLCILDPRLLLDEKSVANENFRDQLAAADVIVANKTDRATPESESALQTWWQQYGDNRQLVHADHGQINGQLLDLPRQNLAELPASAAHTHQHAEEKGSPRLACRRNSAGVAA
ncbi:putative GTP-binding protein YjiA [Citrobacter koseri]|uniref:Putative GTP-binding protein YjiA n=1 Tax=Citrobacter koseri TaxID=545 RepID=A0A3S4JNI6_CITKO|nr:putative GTP-binding protein YjiA [Citrobacter koseri]